MRIGGRVSRLNSRLGLTFALAAIATGCGEEAPASHTSIDRSSSQMPRSLEDVLALEYSGNSLRSLLERGPHPRYESDLLIAFRTCLGTEGGRWLGRAVRSLGPEPTVGKVELLSVDLDAARECQNLLLKWANASPIDAVVLWSIRILLEIDCRAPIPTHKMFEALNGESDMVRQHALQQLDLLGTNIDIIAPELLNILATCRNGHMPSWREVGRGASPFEPEGIQERSRPDSCGRVLRALSRGGPTRSIRATRQVRDCSISWNPPTISPHGRSGRGRLLQRRGAKSSRGRRSGAGCARRQFGRGAGRARCIAK